MNIHKHMEAIFIAALAIIGTGSFVLDATPEADASASLPVVRDVAMPGSPALVMCAPKVPRHA
jgi:hypothetical protein